jgi:Flp pilus assembly protein CpaB
MHVSVHACVALGGMLFTRNRGSSRVPAPEHSKNCTWLVIVQYNHLRCGTVLSKTSIAVGSRSPEPKRAVLTTVVWDVCVGGRVAA